MIEQSDPSFFKYLLQEMEGKQLCLYIDGLDQIGQYKFQVIQ